MKKTIITTLIIVLSVCFIGTIGMLESTYTREVTVVSVKDQEITVEDTQGYLWTFIGEGYEIDQEITVVMNDKHTSIITDDEILRVKS